MFEMVEIVIWSGCALRTIRGFPPMLCSRTVDLVSLEREVSAGHGVRSYDQIIGPNPLCQSTDTEGTLQVAT